MAWFWEPRAEWTLWGKKGEGDGRDRVAVNLLVLWELQGRPGRMLGPDLGMNRGPAPWEDCYLTPKGGSPSPHSGQTDRESECKTGHKCLVKATLRVPELTVAGSEGPAVQPRPAGVPSLVLEEGRPEPPALGAMRTSESFQLPAEHSLSLPEVTVVTANIPSPGALWG